MRKEYTIVDHMVQMGYMDPQLAWERHVDQSMEEFYYIRSGKVLESKWWRIVAINALRWTVVICGLKLLWFLFTNL